MIVHFRSAEAEEDAPPAQERVVGLEIKTSSGKHKKLFSCVYPHTKMCGEVASSQLICRHGYEVVGFHGIFCVSTIRQFIDGMCINRSCGVEPLPA